VTCTATDGAGNQATGSTFDVFVEFVDNTPPVIAAHDDVHAVTGDFRGAIVSYRSPRAVDDADGVSRATCEPPSRSRFPLGHTVVTCSAVDLSGNRAADLQFDVVVELDAAAALEALKDDIESAANVKRGIRNRLTEELDKAIRHLGKGAARKKQYCRALDRFVAELERHRRQGGPRPRQQETWGDWAAAIRATLGC
jgi:hypothetical protein